MRRRRRELRGEYLDVSSSVALLSYVQLSVRVFAKSTMVLRYSNTDSPLNIGAKIFVGRLVNPISLKKLSIISNAALLVKADGTIAGVRDQSLHKFSDADIDVLKTEYAYNGFANAETINLKPSQFLFPGLVDTHLHAPQWPNLALGMEGTLREWVENWTDPMEASYSDTEKARRVYTDVVNTTLRLGSTTVAYNTTIHAEATNVLADAALKAGQRAIVGKMCVTAGSTRGNW